MKFMSNPIPYILLISITLIVPILSSNYDPQLLDDNNQDRISRPTITLTIDMTPFILWSHGQDYPAAQNNRVVATLAKNSSTIITTLYGLSGGTIIVDKLLQCTVDSELSTFQMKIRNALSGTLSPAPSTLKLRFWTGESAPTTDDSAGVEAVLDLTGNQDTETLPISGNQTLYLQLVCTMQSNTSGNSTVKIHPNTIEKTT